MKFLFFTLLALLPLLSCCSQNSLNYFDQWPQFRGPLASGIVSSKNLPDVWDLRTGENLKWKTEILGLGLSSPVVWGDKIFITTAISGSGTDSLKVGLYGDIDAVEDVTEHEFRTICVNRNTGKIEWNVLAVKEVPKTKRHTKASHANPTCATDGNNVVAFFGSEGLYCYDFKGKLIWSRQFERMNAGFYRVPDVEWGFASSPILHEGKVIVQCDFIGDSFLAAYDVKTGDEVWRIARNDEPTWSTPNFYNKDGIKQIVVNGYHHSGGYEFETGKEIWKLDGGGDIPVPTPFFAHNMIYLHSAHGRYSPIFAIRAEANGDITLHKDSTSNDFIVWSIKRGGAYNPTNIVVGDYLYNMRMNGQLTCFDAITGKQMYREKLSFKKGMTASAVSSNGKIYYSGENGEVYIIKTGPVYELVAENSLNDVIMATPAIIANTIIFRTQHHLLAIGK